MIIAALDRKLLRDLAGMKGQAVAISLVIACGVATFVMSVSTLRSLQNAQQTYYDRYRFADVFASLKRAPNTLAERIAEIPGVAHVQTRVVVDVTLDVPDLAEPAVGRLISIPELPRPDLNDLYLRRGRYIEPGGDGEPSREEKLAQLGPMHPIGRVGQPEEVADAAMYLLSPGAGWITGSLFFVDGGISLV